MTAVSPSLPSSFHSSDSLRAIRCCTGPWDYSNERWAAEAEQATYWETLQTGVHLQAEAHTIYLFISSCGFHTDSSEFLFLNNLNNYHSIMTIFTNCWKGPNCGDWGPAPSDNLPSYVSVSVPSWSLHWLHLKATYSVGKGPSRWLPLYSLSFPLTA